MPDEQDERDEDGREEAVVDAEEFGRLLCRADGAATVAADTVVLLIT